MDSARWMPAHIIAERYAVGEAALFRYSQRGMLGARWDEASGGWLYDAFRVRSLFLMREQEVVPAALDSLGILGKVRLAGGPLRRKPAAKAAPQQPGEADGGVRQAS